MEVLMKHKIKLLDVIMITILLGSILVFLYPFVQNQLNTFLDQKVINHYQEQASKENKEEREKIIKEQQKENHNLAKEKSNPGLTAFNAATEENSNKAKKQPLDYYKQHTLGVLYIPSIKLRLPIFDTTNDTLLQKGASLLEGSSYPSKDNNVHSVISAHRGLPEAKLFTDLPKLNIGDSFFIEINGEKLAYEVIETNVVEPTDTDSLKIREDKNLVTLLTCTPYMINTHRLLVTGKQVPYIPKKNDDDISSISTWEKYRFMFLILLTITVFLITAFTLFTWLKRKLISNRLYTLDIQLLNKKKKPLAYESIVLIPNSKKKNELTFKLDASGKIVNSSISGGKYSLQVTSGKYQNAQPVQLRIKKVKNTHFSLISKNKKQKYHIKIIKDNKTTQLLYKKNRKEAVT